MSKYIGTLQDTQQDIIYPQTTQESLVDATYMDAEDVVSIFGDQDIWDGSFVKSKLPTPTPPIRMPIKGDIITMDLGNGSKQYRVLKITGTSTALCIGMYNATSSTTFGSNNTYAGSTLDTYLNQTFYNSLSDTGKGAIIPTNIIQYKYTYNEAAETTTHASRADYSTKAQVAVVGDRYIYAIDVEDIEEYFGGTAGSVSAKTPGTFSTADLLTMIYNNPSKQSGVYSWLRSAYADGSNSVFYVNADIGRVNNRSVFNYTAARPGFQIDLSKIAWA